MRSVGPFEEVEVNEVEAKKLFSRGNRRPKIWNKEKFLQMTEQKKTYYWDMKQFVELFAPNANFEDEKDMRKSIRRFLRRAMKGRGKYELVEDGVFVYRE